MYSKTFLSVCPACTTAERFLRIDLHSIVTCTKCYAKFIAEENYVDIEFDDTCVSQQKVVEETVLPFEALQERTKQDTNKEAIKNYGRQVTSAKEQDAALKWMLVSSRGLQEETSLGNAEIEELKDSVRVDSLETQEHHKDASVQLDNDKAVTEKSSRELGLPNKKNKAQGDSKLKKRKQTQSSATWGIGLRKPLRERRQVKSYSPSRESGILKRRKLRLQKENRDGKSGRIAGKKYRRQKAKRQEPERSQSDDSSDGDVFKGNTATVGTADRFSKPRSEKYSELKNFLKSEIKRQVLEGLGEASTRMIKEIEVVEVEELLPQSLNTQDPTVSDKQEFTAQVKLITTILFPITLNASERPPMKSPESPKSRENVDSVMNFKEWTEDAKEGTEDAEDEVEVVELPELKDVREPEHPKDIEPEHRKDIETEPPKDIETEPLTGLMNDEKLSDYEPLLGDGNNVNVPDSEYYDFEVNRSEDQFAPQQIWASYDLGMMPRDYLQIKRVVNIKPFKVLVSVLEPAWLSESGNPLSCGEFSADSRIRIMTEINGFSHLMNWRSDENGMIHIYPGEKEVWALYKDWKEFDQEKRMRQGYHIVQIASIEGDLTINVFPLVNHKGSKTVFQRRERQLFQIHKKDFDIFSHQIPIFEIIGQNGVEGCMELDPAAIPFE